MRKYTPTAELARLAVRFARDARFTRTLSIRVAAGNLKRAGVGLGTVSRVINDCPQVSKATRERVPATIEGRLSQRLRQLIELRQQCLALADGDHVFGFVRSHGGERVAVLTNFTEQPQSIEAYHVRQHGFTQDCVDLVTGSTIVPAHTLTLEPFQLWCLNMKK